jgi:two-component system cell cycle response regulator
MAAESNSNDSENDHCYAVAVLGFEAKERLLLRNILRISEQHPLAFRPYRPKRDGRPALVIVNGDNAEAVTQWGKLEQERAPNASPMSVIYLARGNPPADAMYSLGRPFVATRLFALLERAVTERHGYLPNLALATDSMLLLTNTGSSASVRETPSNAGQTISAPRVTDDHRARPKIGHSALIVDDSLPVRVQLKGPLEKAFDHVDVAESGEEALELLARRSYDLVLLDVILPGIDGYETCKRIKKDSRHRDTPVVMLTSNSSPADKVKGKLAGCETYLIKPVKASVFETVMYGLVASRAAA